MKSARKPALRELLFRVSVWLKGLNAAAEILAGAALFAVGRGSILRVLAFLTADELAEDPRDLVANRLLSAARHLSLKGEHFMAIYLLSHGAIKLGLVAALLKEKLWAYPLAVAVFGAFIVYQVARFSVTKSAGLLALSLFDAVVILLIWLEYRALKRRRST